MRIPPEVFTVFGSMVCFGWKKIAEPQEVVLDVIREWVSISINTLPETNVAPENRPPQ